MGNEWRGFKGGSWEHEVNVRDFIQQNYTPYFGNGDFLEGPTQDTLDLWKRSVSSRKKKSRTAAFLIWIQKLFQLLLHTVRVILTKTRKKLSACSSR